MPSDPSRTYAHRYLFMFCSHPQNRFLFFDFNRCLYVLHLPLYQPSIFEPFDLVAQCFLDRSCLITELLLRLAIVELIIAL